MNIVKQSHVDGAASCPVPASPATCSAGDGRTRRVAAAVARFVEWLDRYGESSLDFQTQYAGRYGRFAKALYYRHRKAGTLAVAPLVFCEAFVPSARRLFWRPQRFPIGDAHYAMAFVRRFAATNDQRDYRRATHFLEVLLSTSGRARTGLGWGYPFDWVTIDRTIPAGTPLITTLPYVYEAFVAAFEVDRDSRWSDVMRLIAEHARLDYPDHPWRGAGATCSYSPLPGDHGGVVNASAYRAFLLTRAWRDLGDSRYLEAAQPNLEFVVGAQNPDGSWYYAVDGRRSFVDHYHTCFVLKALLKIEVLGGGTSCRAAIDAGLDYYVQHLFDPSGLPRPFARRPRLTVYRRELYDYAECINLLSLARRRRPEFESMQQRVVDDIIGRWQRPDGSFQTRQLMLGWDSVPMHRWGQAQLLRSLCGILADGDQSSDDRRRSGPGQVATLRSRTDDGVRDRSALFKDAGLSCR